jgi:hypothetical protein
MNNLKGKRGSGHIWTIEIEEEGSHQGVGPTENDLRGKTTTNMTMMNTTMNSTIKKSHVANVLCPHANVNVQLKSVARGPYCSWGVDWVSLSPSLGPLLSSF